MSNSIGRLKTAYQVQDACNPVAICGLLQRMASEITQETGMSAIKHDQGFLAVLDKLLDLLERPGPGDLDNALRVCCKIANQDNHEDEPVSHQREFV